MKQDLRFALRMLAKSPAFTSVAVIALALGIGANTAIFSVVNAVLLRPLAYAQPQRLVTIWQRLGTSQGLNRVGASTPDYIDYRDQCRTMQSIAAFRGGDFNMTGRGAPERVNGSRVTANLFPLLGVSPFLGRAFSPEEARPGRDREIVLSYGWWQRRFGADRNALGATIVLDQIPYTVIGVMPKSFDFPPQGFDLAQPAEFWTPLAFGVQELTDRGDSFATYMIGRLKPGVTLAQASADVRRVALRITESYPPDFRVRLRTTAFVEDFEEQLTGRVRLSLLVILSAVGFVLLLACANVASLLLAKAAAREREIAVRRALGASRGRIVRQLLTESILLASMSGALGVVIGVWITDLLIRLSPGNVPRLGEAQLDWRVLAFTLVLSFATGIVFGIAPAWQASKYRRARQRGPLWKGLVVCEVALTLTLLSGAGLLLRSFVNLRGSPVGFNPDRVLTAGITIPQSRYPKEAQIKAFYGELIRRVQALGGVQSAALATALPFAGNWDIAISIEGEHNTLAFKTADFHGITPRYFSTLGIELKRGRLFTADDRENTAPVAIVSEAMARQYWPHRDVLGKRFKWGPDKSDRPWLQIVGVAADVKQSNLEETARPAAYLPYSQMPKFSTEHSGRNVYLALRTAGDPVALAADVRKIVNGLDPELPVYAVSDMNSRLSTNLAPRRFNMILLAGFAGLALLLASLGVYAVMSYTVQQFTHEIGIRMALGASATSAVQMMLRQGMSLVLGGIVIGAAAALVLTRLMKSLLFKVQPNDPATFAAVSLLLAAVAFVASYVPARRAARVDPIVALRFE